MKILSFLKSLRLHVQLPGNGVAMNPYQDKSIFKYCEKFYTKYYDDNRTRKLILGINPGRLGGGLTGIPFTDPVKLEQECHIANDLPKKKELSADFIHLVIHALGGLKEFYSQYYFSSVCPLGFTLDGKNLNYYDVKELQVAVTPFIIKTIRKQLDFGLDTDVAFCLGEGKNLKFLNALNDENRFFDKIVPLAHPRFIMQYKRKKVKDYIQKYKSALTHYS